MKSETRVDIRHLARVEGHGNIMVEIAAGRLLRAQWQVVETPRFFEAMLRGRSWPGVPSLCGRICGICSIGHTLASIRAIERAFGFQPGQRTASLRLLLKHMETLQSHILHIFFLAAPDYLGSDSLIELRGSRPELLALAARLKQLANDGADLIGGRRLHPPRLKVGGFTMLPEKETLARLRTRLDQARDDLAAAAELLAGFAFPDFTRESEYVSLKGEEGYPFIGGSLCSSDGVVHEEDDYLQMTNEYCLDQSTSKWCRLSRDSYAVGALARLNNNGRLLHPGAAAMAEMLGLRPFCHNPFRNTAAQLVECLQVVEDGERLIDELLAMDWRQDEPAVVARAGTGVGAVEVPRGILYHCYTIDESGFISTADCVIPTSQNHGNIQNDLSKMAGEAAAAGLADTTIEQLASMLVRAYDPCISCSVH